LAVRKRSPRVRLKSWPTDDWYFTHVGYRFIKATFHHPVRWAAGLRVRGAENVPSSGPVLLAVNHLSYADPVLVGAAIHRPAFYLAKEGLFRHPVEALGQVKVNRSEGGNEGAVQTAVGLLAQGLVVGVFPEGTLSRPGQVKRGKTGVARIAARSGAPVVPIGIDATAFWPKGQRMPRLGARVYADVGAPMRLDLKPGDAEDRQKMRDATDDVMERVARLLQNAREARERGETWA
jgi:1-acyl-sn-glycerol-3-phosphate acyltransferase